MANNLSFNVYSPYSNVEIPGDDANRPYIPSSQDRAHQYDAYALLHAAANHIEQHPDLYNFKNGLNAHKSRCMLGRIAAIANLKYLDANSVAAHILGIGPEQFFNRITAYIGMAGEASESCLYRPHLVVPAMRRLAEDYFSPAALAKATPPPPPVAVVKPVAVAMPPAPREWPTLPDSVRDIFKKGAIESFMVDLV